MKQRATTGLNDFKLLLKEFRGLSIWAVGSGLAVPFVAAMADFSPPWPPGIVPVTAVIELMTLVIVFQHFKNTAKRIVNRVLVISSILFVVTGLPYLFGLSLYTYQVPVTKQRLVKGYECTRDAKAVFKELCPDLGLDELQTAEYQAERLWTLKSISLIRIALVFAWSLTFAALSSALGVFLVYQMRSKTNKR